jgi:hypothetical protein
VGEVVKVMGRQRVLVKVRRRGVDSFIGGVGAAFILPPSLCILRVYLPVLNPQPQRRSAPVLNLAKQRLARPF